MSFARAPVIGDHWRRTSNLQYVIKAIDETNETNQNVHS